MKKMFFKTVRHDGKSVYARGPLCRTYKVGKRYRFRKEFPAHVFLGTFFNDGSLNAEWTYDGRREESRGNRVLICYGEVIRKEVPCFDVLSHSWDLTRDPLCFPMEERETCSDFVVIGELPLPAYYNGVRPEESDKEHYPDKIIMPGQFKKKS